MSPRATKSPPEYLREARIDSGCVSRSTACFRVPYSLETIGRHERGDVSISPDDIVCYARGYQAPDILYQYCARCSVGRELGKCVTERPLPFAALRFRQMTEEAQHWAERLEEIAFDGKVDDQEREEYQTAMHFLLELENTILDMLLLGAKKKTPAPERTERAGITTHHNNNTNIKKRQGRKSL